MQGLQWQQFVKVFMYVLSHINIIWFYSKLLKQSPLRQQKALATRNVIKKSKM